MKKTVSKPQENDEMRPEYDFRGAVRGRHHRRLDKGYTVEVHQPDGTTVIEHYQLVEGAILLQPDVRAYFPDSEAVNKALRSLITLMAEMPPESKKPQQGTHPVASD